MTDHAPLAVSEAELRALIELEREREGAEPPTYEETWAAMGWAPQPRQQTALSFLRAVDPAEQKDYFAMLFGGAAGGSKALAMDTPVPTPDGWKMHGDLRVGDTIFTASGAQTEVVAAHPVEREECFLVRFDDGAEVVAGAGHLWLTLTAPELASLSRRTDEWRAKRRESRASRRSGNKSDAFYASLVARNKTVFRPAVMDAPAGTLKETRVIAESMQGWGGRSNHAVALAGALEMHEAILPIDPYLLGCWIGDGTTSAGSITSLDPEVFAAFKAQYREGAVAPKSDTQALSVNYLGLRVALRKAGVLGNKHIPPMYLRASRAQRLALLQGLMDTDGTNHHASGVSFCTTKLPIAEGVHELVLSLGYKVGPLNARRSKLYGVDCGPMWNISWTPAECMFRLFRKASRQGHPDSRRTKFRYITSCESVGVRDVRCITVADESGMYLAGRSMVPTHNSDLLRSFLIAYCRRYPGVRALLLRKTLPRVRDNHEMHILGAAYLTIPKGWHHYNRADHIFTFASGSVLQLGYISEDSDVLRYQGIPEIECIAFDEGSEISPFAIAYLTSRIRSSKPGVPRYLLICTNPGGLSHGFLKSTFARAAPPETLFTARIGLNDGKKAEVPAVFIPSKVDDNQILLKNNPGYKDQLDALPENERKALRDGDWDVFAGQFFSSWRWDKHVIPPFTVPEHWRKWGGLDWGHAAPLSFHVATQDPDTRRIYIIRELYQKGLHDSEAVQRITATAGGYQLDAIYADPSMWQKRGHDDALSTADVYLQGGLPLVPGNNNRMNGWRRFREVLEDGDDGIPLMQVFSNCTNMIRTVPEMIHDATRPEDMEEGEDHCSDSGRYLLISRSTVRVLHQRPTRQLSAHEYRGGRVVSAEQRFLTSRR